MRAAAILSMAEDAAVFYYPDSGKIKKLSLTGSAVYAAAAGSTGRNSFFTRCGSLGMQIVRRGREISIYCSKPCFRYSQAGYIQRSLGFPALHRSVSHAAFVFGTGI